MSYDNKAPEQEFDILEPAYQAEVRRRIVELQKKEAKHGLTEEEDVELYYSRLTVELAESQLDESAKRRSAKRLKCPHCGYEATILGVLVGDAFIFGSDADFCIRCDKPWGRNYEQ